MKRLIASLVLIVIVVVSSCKKNKDSAAPTAPLVKTSAIINNGGGNISAGGSIISDGGASVTKSGIAWSQGHATPTITDSVVESTVTTGAFTINISGIDFGKTYYFRAFATNSIGTGYGDVVTLTTSNDSVRFTYNGQTVTYGIIVSSASGKKWLDRNLGAKRAATSYDDYQAYGDLFQWGRPADGHQLINWTSSTTGTAVNGKTETLATSDNPGHSNFILFPWTNDTNQDWRDNNNSNRWATIPQGPCPNGWHVPSIDEWLAEISKAKGGTANSGGMSEINSGYSQLKLTICGNRFQDGAGTVNFSKVGHGGYYWSRSEAVIDIAGYTGGENIGIATGGINGKGWPVAKGNSLAVRCIKDN